MADDKPVLDRQFIVAALAIGLGYALIVIVGGYILNKEAVGILGVALTSLAVAILAQFKTLRFQPVTAGEEQIVQIPRIRVLRLLVATLLCFCLSIAVPAIVCISYLTWRLRSVSLTPENYLMTMYQIGDDLGHYENTHWFFHYGVLAGIGASYFLFGAICARFAARRSAYLYALLGSLLTQIAPFLFLGFCWVLKKLLAIPKPLPTYSLHDGIYSAVFVALAFCGSYFVAVRRQKRLSVGTPAA